MDLEERRNNINHAQYFTLCCHVLVNSTDSLLISNMCGECDVSGSRETARKESPERGRMPCEIREDKDHVCQCASGSSKEMIMEEN